MAVSAASTVAISPAAAPAVNAPATPATGTANPTGTASPFQALLAAITTTAVAKAPSPAVPSTNNTKTNNPNTPADSTLVGFLALAAQFQFLTPPTNAAIAQANGIATTAAATPPAATTATGISRAGDLLLNRAGGPALGTITNPTGNAANLTTATNNLLTATAPGTTAAGTAQSAAAVQTAAAQTAAANALPTLPTTPAIPTQTPVGAALASAARGGPANIPPLAPIISNLTPNVPAPADLSTIAPAVNEPAATIPVSGLPAAELGDRPTMAGDRFAAIASAGAQLGPVNPPPSGAFANVLNETAPVSATASVTATLTPTASATVTAVTLPTTTATVAATLTPTASASVTATLTPTASASATATPTPTTTATVAATLTPTASASVTATPTASATVAATLTPTAYARVAPHSAPGETAVGGTLIVQPTSPLLNGDTVQISSLTNAGTPSALNVSSVNALASAVPPVLTPGSTAESRPTDTTTTNASAAASVLVNAPAINLPAPSAPAPTNTTGTTALATPATQVADAVVSQASVLERPGSTEFHMRLDPPELGRVQIRLTASGDEIHGQVLVASDSVKQMLESQMPELRQRLEAAGVNMQQFNIATDAGTGGSRNSYRDATPEFPTHTAAAEPPAASPRARIGRIETGSLDVTV